MKKRKNYTVTTLVTLALGMSSFFISMALLYRLGLYFNEYLSSPSMIYSDCFWLTLGWLGVLLEFLVVLFTLVLITVYQDKYSG